MIVKFADFSRAAHEFTTSTLALRVEGLIQYSDVDTYTSFIVLHIQDEIANEFVLQ